LGLVRVHCYCSLLKALQITIAVAMIGVAVFSLLNKNLGQASHDVPASQFGVVAGYAAAFVLAIYGGFFSGGYVTMLTAAFVLLFGMTFLQAVATTKVINVFLSGVATLIFVWRGVVESEAGHHSWRFHVSGCAGWEPASHYS
jgi:hypothetical protein